MNLIYLVRHGENTANLTKEFSHRLVDYSLTEKGILQAQQTAQVFVNKNIQAVYASPLKRATETAQIIGSCLGLPVTIMENFREVNVGALERGAITAEKWIYHNEIIRAWFEGRMDMRFPEGEDMYELVARMREGLRFVLEGRDHQNIVIVGHGGIFTFTLSSLCEGIDLQALDLADNQNCSISELEMEWTGDRLSCRLVRWADYSHLHGVAAKLVPGAPDLEALHSRGEIR